MTGGFFLILLVSPNDQRFSKNDIQVVTVEAIPNPATPKMPDDIDMNPKQTRKEASAKKKTETKQRRKMAFGDGRDEEAMAAAAALMRQANYPFENHNYIP